MQKPKKSAAKPAQNDTRERILQVSEDAFAYYGFSGASLQDIADRVGHAYSGMPDRLYLIDKSGRVAYKGGRGPFGFKPGELEHAIKDLGLKGLKLAPVYQNFHPADPRMQPVRSSLSRRNRASLPRNGRLCPRRRRQTVNLRPTKQRLSSRVHVCSCTTDPCSVCKGRRAPLKMI